MMMCKPIGLFALIPVTLLLTVSFFVVISLNKAGSQNVKTFGRIIIALLWICALLVFSVGVYKMSKGRCMLMGKPGAKRGGMSMMKGCPGGKMMKGKPAPMMQQGMEEPAGK